MTEYVTNPNSPDEWRCPCGNTVDGSGFENCLIDGTVVLPDLGSDWDGLYRCADCGRIIALECVNLPYSDGQIVATAAVAGTVGIATEGWARFPEVRAYASHRGVTVAEAIVALVNSGLSHESRSYV